eukprot:Cvel_24216.t1-p1 / transcript=Cvel_24216.t1 / gene=Cvel_24216 / organism=Chromera_velia_CCMP2878 / gene_product=hypothetical protein / transcript_product=hypothetical protein / location=Cvel_scaffold2588:24056-24422(+) / protein_length=122 / sequence_SO=supercontig / SO=protein_coding / is_pseudo=false
MSPTTHHTNGVNAQLANATMTPIGLAAQRPQPDLQEPPLSSAYVGLINTNMLPAAAALNNTNMTGPLPTHIVTNAYQIIVTVTADSGTNEINDENISAAEMAPLPGMTTNTEYSPTVLRQAI